MTFAERLKELRTERGMSMDDVGRVLGVGRANIYKYEHGIVTNIPPERVHMLANLFGVTRPYMMGWTDERNANPSENLDMVAEKLRTQTDTEPVYWKSTWLAESDCITAATQASRAIIKFGISRAPIYPHQILQKSEIATMVSFANERELDDISLYSKLTSFRKENDLVMSSIHKTGDGKEHYIFAVNRDAPMGKIRLALAVELGHIYLGHTKVHENGVKNANEAECFAVHFEFPRALIRLLTERGYVFTKESFSRIFGDCEWCLDAMTKAEPIVVSPELNRMVKELFIPHVNLLEESGILTMPAKGDVLDLSGYMAGYED